MIRNSLTSTEVASLLSRPFVQLQGKIFKETATTAWVLLLVFTCGIEQGCSI